MKHKYVLLINKEKSHIEEPIEKLSIQTHLDSFKILKEDMKNLMDLTFGKDYFVNNKYTFPKEIDLDNLCSYKSDLSQYVYFDVYCLFY